MADSLDKTVRPVAIEFIAYATIASFDTVGEAPVPAIEVGIAPPGVPSGRV
jgi:hypothetical protein